MARALIVGCGCRGQALADRLVADGYAVRGTSRDAGRAEAIRATGAEPYVGDPARLGTLVAALEGVSVVCWLLASASGPPEAVADLHGACLRTLLEEIVDSPVRGFVYEAAGDLAPDVLAGGAALVRRAHQTWRIPVAMLAEAPADHARWLAAAQEAVRATLAGEGKTGKSR